MKKFAFFFLFPSFAFSNNGNTSGETPGKYFINASGHYGFIIAHRSSIVALQRDHVKAFELGLFKPSSGSKTWQRIYDYPDIGIKYFFFNLGNSEQTGMAHSLVPCLDFEFSKNPNFAFHFSWGIGLGYVTKVFDQQTNHKNIAIGTKLNAAFHLAAEYQARISQRIYGSVGLNFNHFSNGAVAVPNLGFNIPSAKAGIRYYFGEKQILVKDSLPPLVRRFRHSFVAAGAIKEIYPVHGPDYYVYSLSFSSVKQCTRKSAAGLGLDVHYDNSLLEKLSTNANPDPPNGDGVRVGVNASYEMIFSDFSMMLQMGRYLYSKLTTEGDYYQRLGLRYEFFRQWFGCVNLKVHFGKADHIEFGIGKRF